jgi:hypothetical protein
MPLSASSLKQQSADEHVAPLGHIILIPSQPVFALFSDSFLKAKVAFCLLESSQSQRFY